VLLGVSVAEPRRFIKELDSRYVIPAEWNPIRVLLVRQEPNNDGGTGSHYVYVTLCEEVDTGG
jgi:hypothetical protein